MATADVVAEIRRLMDREGRITPEQVLEAAKDEASPLHQHFTFDQSVAAHRYNLMEARQLIRSVRIEVVREVRRLEIQTRKTLVPGFVRDPRSSAQESGYRAIERLKADEDDSREAIIAEFKRAGAALKRAKDIAAYLEAAAPEEIEGLIQQVMAVSQAFEEDTASH